MLIQHTVVSTLEKKQKKPSYPDDREVICWLGFADVIFLMGGSVIGSV